MRFLAFLYGLVCYGVFFLTFLYAVGFLGNFGVPRTVDAGGAAAPFGLALAINVGLLGLFGLQHSVMARQGFKRAWTKVVPAPVERSTYVLLSSLLLILLFWQWRPMPGVVWEVEDSIGGGVLWALFGAGWVLVLLSSFAISHFDLFGLQQVYRYLHGREQAAPGFKMPLLYKIVRHPLYVGWITVFWAIPRMTVGHMVFAVVATAYILVAIQLEERDLARFHPEYGEYRKRVPMLIPLPRRK
ncbi:MAG: methanethiol S-methyltransferase [Terriglobia bacterium]